MQFLKYTKPTKTEDPRGASRDASERLVPPLHLLLFPFLYLRTSVLLKDRTLRPWEVAPAATSLTPPPPSLDQASSSNTKDSLESVLVSACLYFFLYVCVFCVGTCLQAKKSLDSANSTQTFRKRIKLETTFCMGLIVRSICVYVVCYLYICMGDRLV